MRAQFNLAAGSGGPLRDGGGSFPPRRKPWWDHPSNDPSGHALHELELPAIGVLAADSRSRAPTLCGLAQDGDCAECFVEVLGCHI